MKENGITLELGYVSNTFLRNKFYYFAKHLSEGFVKLLGASYKIVKIEEIRPNPTTAYFLHYKMLMQTRIGIALFSKNAEAEKRIVDYTLKPIVHDKITQYFDLEGTNVLSNASAAETYRGTEFGAYLADSNRFLSAAEEETFKLDMSTRAADFLVPYLVSYKNGPLSYEESWTAYNSCLNDLKTRYVGLLNGLQRQYEDLTIEAKSLNRFLNKFEVQLDNYNYNKLLEHVNVIALHKRMVQQRLTSTHEESQKKYEIVKSSLMTDDRLNLKKKSPAENKKYIC